MGVNISMSMGWGIHIPQDVFGKWAEGWDDEYEALASVLEEHGESLTYDYAGNAWQGEENGIVVYAKGTYQSFDMGREAEAGVYRAPKQGLALSSQYQLDEVSVIIAGEYLPIEWLVTVGVS